jgi:ribosomal protein S18 acetylase RimI-like enzyme
MRPRRASEDDRRPMAELAAALQARPEHHVAYLGVEPDTIAEEMLEDVDDWTEAAVLVEEAGRMVGWLMGSIDHEMGRVWWLGPFVDRDDPAEWVSVATALDDAARRVLGAHVTEEEYAFDDRHRTGIEWARSRGGVVDSGSAVLRLTGPSPASASASAGPVIRPIRDDDGAVVGPLHAALFPGTHTTGSVLVSRRDEDHLRLVAEEDGTVVGYVAVERQADGDGYVDYVGVAPSRRRRGLGAALIRAGVRALRELGCGQIHLTVRADNQAARALYAGLGFVEERVIVPVRVGFSLG